MEQVETTSAGQVGPEFCHICDQRHSCGQSTPSVVQSFEIDGSQSRSCYKKFLIICILALLVLILAVIILRNIF